MTQYSVSSYTSDGVTTDFLITWDYLDEDHITVWVASVNVAEAGSGYSSQLINSTTVRVVDEFDQPVQAGLTVELKRQTPIQTRVITYADGGSLTAEDLNKNSDYLLYAMQEAVDTVDSAAQNGAEAAKIQAELLRDEVELLRDTTLVYRNETLTYLDGVRADVDVVAALDAEITTVVNNITAVQNAASNATDAAASQTAAAASAASALSSKNSAALSESNALSSKNSAATSATASANSATASAASAVTAGAHETAALASKNAAATSEANALASKNAAATSAANALASENAAASSEAVTQALFDDFDATYLGDFASDPTVDNNGNALQTGALYYNTALNNMKVYNGSSWDAAYLPATGFLQGTNNLSDLANAATALNNLGITATAAEINFVTNVTSDVQAQINTKMASAGGTFTGNVVHSDNVTASFGTGGDMALYHNGTNSTINNATGTLTVNGAAGDVILSRAGTSRVTVNTAGAVVNGTAEMTTGKIGAWTWYVTSNVLYFAYNGAAKFKVDSNGNATFAGNVTAYGSV